MSEIDYRALLDKAEETLQKDRVYNGQGSASNYEAAYSAARMVIRDLEKRLEVYEHAHEWTVYAFEGSGGQFRTCPCGAVEGWDVGSWHKMELSE